jgi:thiol-disulfide isomerase/thioredoxin
MSLVSFSQFQIVGEFTGADVDQYTVYISEYFGYPKTSKAFDSAAIMKDGSFRIQVPESNYDSSVLQLVVAKSGTGGRSKNEDGIHDNMILLPVMRGATLQLTASVDSFYNSVQFLGNDSLNEHYTRLWEARKPVKQLAANYAKLSRELKPEELAAMRSSFMDSITINYNLTKNTLAVFLEEEQDPFFLTSYLFEYLKACGGDYDVTLFREKLPLLKKYPAITKEIQNNLYSIGNPELNSIFANTPLQSLATLKNEMLTPNQNRIYIFWASWCGPCRVTNRSIVQKGLYSKLKGQVELVSIAVDKNKELSIAAYQKDGVDWPQYFDSNNIFGKLKFGSLPTYVSYESKSDTYTVHRNFEQALKRFGIDE